jgi:winged helix domain-containing protein/ATPase family protein associated with various cellular activities (AAA)
MTDALRARARSGGRPKQRPAARPYANDRELLADELARLELVVRAHLTRAGVAAGIPVSEPLRGLYLSESEVQRLLRSAGEDEDAVRAVLASAASVAATIEQRRAATRAAGVLLRLPLLAHLFGLSQAEERLLVICVAPELDSRYEKFYAFLNDDVTRKGPTAHLALALLSEAEDERRQARMHLSGGGRLFRTGLLATADDGTGAGARMGRVLRVDERIGEFLLGESALPPAVAHAASVWSPARVVASAVAQRLAGAVREHLERADGGRLVVQLTGAGGVGKRALAEQVCALLGTPLLVLDLDELAGSPDLMEQLLRLALREAVLQPAVVYLEGIERLQSAAGVADDGGSQRRGERSLYAALARAIEDYSWLTFIATDRAVPRVGRWRGLAWLQVALRRPDDGELVACWDAALAGYGVSLPGADVDSLAGRFRFTPGQMRSVLRDALAERHLAAGGGGVIDAPAIAHACRRASEMALDGLAQRIEPRYQWADLVLPVNESSQLREMCAMMRHRALVYGAWGLGAKHARGKGLAALFFGPSGTGKTMAAEVIANDLELDLYRIDLSAVVSKYIGETEKNLAKVFREAERGSAVLLFDEADALFGKRSEVKDAHDRYANIEISYLLQRMEEYEGIVVLASNLKKNMDDAFLRRLQFTIEFSFPTVAQRRDIWAALLPASPPRGADVDFQFLAERLPITGGNIRNVVMRAAFLAAADGGVIRMQHLMRSAKREYDKIGRLGGESDFGPYWTIVEQRTT